jgi:hypothetical protein
VQGLEDALLFHVLRPGANTVHAETGVPFGDLLGLQLGDRLDWGQPRVFSQRGWDALQGVCKRAEGKLLNPFDLNLKKFSLK